ncbi:unnamed protein product [Didymodactylos carnosus]|uniref:Exonuclease domain-containing protein n=1 Tax=Didymodactylos carnosus TaxID=1234261 RepID=A0A814DVZ3_9BILA|nr:unnamed protein product [Didymodactylos carnosus]CAF1078434.1 unnamed protein product [Didymodactylos carnosus]CAF3734135.1 unnamed protein product [Didymodactylos carnosus]CAF3841833.1 unnamed protein product [Didymodactylos carnosus]
MGTNPLTTILVSWSSTYAQNMSSKAVGHLDSTPKNNDVEIKTNKIDASEKDHQAVEDSNDVIQPTQGSKKSQDIVSNSNQSIQILSIDVECVATGYSHLDRAPCSVAIVNDQCEILFDSLIKPDKPIVSDLFPFSGVRKVDLHHAPSFDEVIKKVHSFFTPTTLIVGQSIMSDVNWMKLEKDVHYSDLIELGDEFETFNPKYGNKTYFSLAHEAYVLLKIDLNATEGHLARNDAKASIQLYNKYLKDKDQSKLEQARRELLRAPTTISPLRRFSGVYEKVCLSAFNPGFCRCGQPMVNELHKRPNKKRSQNSNDQKEELSPSTNKKMKVIDEKNKS